jgi:integrase
MSEPVPFSTTKPTPHKEKPLPSYRRHKKSGQAITTLVDGLGGRKDVLLGTYGSAASRQEYLRVIGEWEANGRRLPAPTNALDLTVAELLVAYWQHAVNYYGFGQRKRTGTEMCLRHALRVLRELYGNTAASNFGPLSLKACRQKMLTLDWSRRYINAQVDKLRRVFKWAASEQLVPGSVYLDLKTVEGLRRGRSAARETNGVRPVPQEHADAALAKLRPVIAAMVRFQALTGCRPAEVCIVRPVDLDMRNPACWVYRPGSDQAHGVHKTAYRGSDRLILIGPAAQEVLRPWLGTKVDGYCFSPVQAEAARNAARKAGRQTPMTPSQAQRRPARCRKRPHGDHYDVTSYRNAIWRACDRADCPRWSPNRLRHNRATQLRCHGLDVTKTILGHTKVETTQIYAERDLNAAMELVSRIG